MGPSFFQLRESVSFRGLPVHQNQGVGISSSCVTLWDAFDRGLRVISSAYWTTKLTIINAMPNDKRGPSCNLKRPTARSSVRY